MIIKIKSFGDSQGDVLFELYSIVCLSLTQCSVIGIEHQSQVLQLLKVLTIWEKGLIIGNRNLQCLRGKRKGNWARVWALAVISETRGKGASQFEIQRDFS